MASTLPQRTKPPWLPPLRELLLDDPEWVFRSGPEPGAPAGTARLRVWRAGERGHFAVVTQGGAGASVTTGAREIWRVLSEVYGAPLGLAEFWPHDQDPAAGVHADLVLPPKPGGEPRHLRLWPAAGYHPHTVMFDAWWASYGLQIMAE